MGGGPSASPVWERLRALHEHHRDLDDGAVASYIPELAKADPAAFGISLVTLDGHRYDVGDTEVPFTIQSISKPFVYSLALASMGRDAVVARVGVEPTGEAFNSILLDEATNRPFNPMVNAGAIAATDLIAQRPGAGRREQITGHLSAYAGRPLTLDDAVFRSEQDTGHRNRAIAHLMRNFDMIDDVEGSLDAYFAQCSLLVDAGTLATMAATLANGGVHPVTGDRVVPHEVTADVLSVMSTCGMYDASGEWVYRVGIPAKSGVSGGIIGVLPGQAGIAVYSPLLDPRGNSCRGLAVFQDLSRVLGLHMFRDRLAPTSAIRRVRDGRRSGSRRVRSEHEHEVLATIGHRLATFELQGPLVFGTTERVVRRIAETSHDAGYVVVDVSRVTDVDTASAAVLRDMFVGVCTGSTAVALAGVAMAPALAIALEGAGLPYAPTGPRRFSTLDEALEWCEDELLSTSTFSTPPRFDPGAVDLFAGLGEGVLGVLATAARRDKFSAGSVVAREGDPADDLLVVETGVLEVVAEHDGTVRRLRTHGPGSTLGEAALLGAATRSATVRARTDVALHRIPTVVLTELCDADARAGTTLYRNLARTIADRLARTNRYHDTDA